MKKLFITAVLVHAFFNATALAMHSMPLTCPTENMVPQYQLTPYQPMPSAPPNESPDIQVPILPAPKIFTPADIKEYASQKALCAQLAGEVAHHASSVKFWQGIAFLSILNEFGAILPKFLGWETPECDLNALDVIKTCGNAAMGISGAILSGRSIHKYTCTTKNKKEVEVQLQELLQRLRDQENPQERQLQELTSPPAYDFKEFSTPAANKQNELLENQFPIPSTPQGACTLEDIQRFGEQQALCARLESESAQHTSAHYFWGAINVASALNLASNTIPGFLGWIPQECLYNTPNYVRACANAAVGLTAFVLCLKSLYQENKTYNEREQASSRLVEMPQELENQE